MDEKYCSFLLPPDENVLPFLKAIVEGMPGGFLIYRADGNEEILHINRAVLRIFGCDTAEEFQELTGNTFRGMVHPDDIDEVEKSIAEQISNSIYDLDYVEYRIRQKDGSTRWIQDYGHFIHSPVCGGDIFYVFLEDATERMKKRMSHLEEINRELMDAYTMEKQYRKAILYDALYFFEVNLTANRFITPITQTVAEQGFGLFHDSEITGDMSFTEFVEVCAQKKDAEELERYRKFFDIGRLIQCFRTGELEQTYDSWVTDPIGRKRLSHYVILLGSNKFSGDIVALIMTKDFTEQMERQELLQSSLQQAQAAHSAKNTFLANMSHDVRTPLNAILGFTDLIQLHRNEPDKVGEYLENIKLSGRQLLTIINEVLEVTRMEAGNAALAETECHLSDLLADTEKAALPAMNAKNLCFTVDVSGVEHFNVLADRIRIREILCQLLDNAAKYTEPDGAVILTVSEEPSRGGYGWYVFIVEDSGIGISEEFMEHLFEPFAREQNTTKSRVPGSGLGMTVVKNLVEMMQGKIEVESRIGNGSKITVTLLLRQLEGDCSGPEAAPLLDIPAPEMRILLVDDNEINREIAKALLSEEGYIIETASDGDIAVEMARSSSPGYYSLVLMDIQMPSMNGYDAARAIRASENPIIADIPIIALSANTYAEDQKKSIESGMDAHASKPLDIADLQEIIQTVLSRRAGSAHKTP